MKDLKLGLQSGTGSIQWGKFPHTVELLCFFDNEDNLDLYFQAMRTALQRDKENHIRPFYLDFGLGNGHKVVEDYYSPLVMA